MVKTTEREAQNSPQDDKQHGEIRKPRTTTERQFRKRMDGLILWQYFVDLLMCPNWQPYLRWTGNKLEFLLIDGVVVFTEFQQRKWQNADPTPISQDPGVRWKDVLISKEDVKNRLRGLCSEYYKRNAEERDNKPLIEKRIGMKGGYAFTLHKSICERVGLTMEALLKYTEDVGKLYEYPATTRIFKDKTQQREKSNELEEYFTPISPSNGSPSTGTPLPSSQGTLTSSPSNGQSHSVEDPTPHFGMPRPHINPMNPDSNLVFPPQPQLPPVSSMQLPIQLASLPSHQPQFSLPGPNFPQTAFPTLPPMQNQFFRGDHPYVEQDSLCSNGYRSANGYSDFGPPAQYVGYEQSTKLFAQPSTEYFAQPCAEYQYSQSALQPTGYHTSAYTDYRNNQHQYYDTDSDSSYQYSESGSDYQSCYGGWSDTSSQHDPLDGYVTPLPFDELLNAGEEDPDMEMLSATLTLATIGATLPRPSEPASPMTEILRNTTSPYPVDVPSLDTILKNVIDYENEQKQLTQL